MERMMTGDGRVRTFAECRNRRNRRTLLRVSVVLGVLLAAILALLFCLAIRRPGPFAPGVAQAKYSRALESDCRQPVEQDSRRLSGTETDQAQQRRERGFAHLSRCATQLFDDACRGASPGGHVGVPYGGRAAAAAGREDIPVSERGRVEGGGEKQASQWVAEPGTSEHELGLAVDMNASGATGTKDSVNEHQWLADNAWRYGFILRYPRGKTDVTGNAYESWHYRYVGAEAAKAMHESGQTLEEYAK